MRPPPYNMTDPMSVHPIMYASACLLATASSVLDLCVHTMQSYEIGMRCQRLETRRRAFFEPCDGGNPGCEHGCLSSPSRPSKRVSRDRGRRFELAVGREMRRGKGTEAETGGIAELTLVNQRAWAKRQRTDPVVVRRIKGPSGCMLEKKRCAVVQSGIKLWGVGGIAGEFHKMPACRGSGYDAKILLRGVAPRDPWVQHAQPCYSRAGVLSSPLLLGHANSQSGIHQMPPT